MTTHPSRACELCARPATAYRNCRGIMRHCCAACYTDERRRASDELAEAAAQDPRWRRVLAREGRMEAGPPPLRVGSLFSGIGGIDLGLQRAGMEIAFQVEIDDYCNRVLAKHWPDVPRFRDVRACGAHNLPAIDVLAGGFPCQPHSYAGRRRASGDERDLWPEFRRLICELGPRWVLAENVPGLLSSDDGRFFGGILRDLAAFGYGAEWHCIPASYVGAPHIRDRVFVLAYSDGARDGGPQHKICPGWDAAHRGGADGRAPDVADANGSRLAQWACVGDDACEKLTAVKRGCGEGGGQWAVEPGMGGALDGFSAGLDEARRVTLATAWAPGWEDGIPRVKNGIPHRVARLRGLGNAVVPQVAEFIGHAIVAAYARFLGEQARAARVSTR